jgi:hypothetical protein
MAAKKVDETVEYEEYDTEPEFNFTDELPDLPARKPKADKLLTRFAEALQDNPGRWACWPRLGSESSLRSLQSMLNNDNLDDGPVAFRGAKFEASRRNDGNLYVRFIG